MRMVGLRPSLAIGRGTRRPALNARRVTERRPGRDGGILVQALLEFIDLPLQGPQPLLVLLNKGDYRRLGGRRNLVPEFSGDRGLWPHAAELRGLPAEGKAGP